MIQNDAQVGMSTLLPRLHKTLQGLGSGELGRFMILRYTALEACEAVTAVLSSAWCSFAHQSSCSAPHSRVPNVNVTAR